MVEPTLRVTTVPTIVSASEKINVIPARAELRVDCRVPPGIGDETTMARVREVLGEPPTGSTSSSPRPWSATTRRSRRR